jgi:hypothetical protein
MKTVTILLILLLASGMLGCSRQQQSRHIVILPDVSGSIERDSLQQAFKAIDEMVGHLQRGDRITVIPILGDAQAEASGRIIRFEVPNKRTAYDADLRSFRSQLSASLQQMQEAAIAHPGPKTDILGSLALAEQELDAQPTSSQILIVLSDFLQDDGEIDFEKDKELEVSPSPRGLPIG